MSLVHELAASVQCCFDLFGTQSDGVLLSRHDQGVLNEVSSILQPVLLRLQKQAVTVAESSELFAEDEQLLGAVVQLRQALESLHASVGRCRVSHWLLRVLTAEDVRRGLEGGLAHTERALQQLVTAEGTADVAPLHEVAALQSSLCEHKVTRHEALERLGTGLYKHMEQATDAEQVVSMLRFVVREAQNLMMRRKHSRASSSSSSRRDSDASDTSTAKVDQDAAANNSSGGVTAAAAGGAAASTSSMDTGSSSDASSSSSGSGSSHHKTNNSAGSSSEIAGASSNSSSKSKAANKPGDIPPGETSLTDVALLLAVQQLADEKQGTQQLVLHQILSILEELHEQKAHQLKHKHRRAAAAANGTHPSSGGPLQSVPEGSDDTIAAMRAAAAANGARAQPYYGAAAAAATAGYYSSGTAAAVAAARLDGSNGQPVTYGSAVAAVSGGLEQLLLVDPWDTAALTQLLELLLQAAAEDEFVEVEEDSSSSSGSGKPPKDSSSSSSSGSTGKGGRKWWQVGSLSKSKSASKGNSSSSGGSSSKSAVRTAANEAAQAQQRQRQERVHQLVASALDVLLRLTPLPAGQDSTFKSVSRADVPPVRSLALPLMAHCDTAKALSGCIWSSWPDVQTKAARLLAILVKSEADLDESAGIAAAVGLASSPASIYAHFCHSVCSSGGGSGSAWHGLITLLHSSNLGTAAAGAEAIAAVGACSHSAEVCSSMAASQATRALLNLLSKHGSHLGAAGAAAAALHSLGDPRTRPAMHDLLVSSYTDQVNGAAIALGESCIAIMLSSDCLAACRAARLAASVAHGINWSATVAAGSSGNTGASSISAGASLWGESFRAGQHLLQRSRDSSASSNGTESSPTVAGAALLQELVVRGCPRGGAEAVAAGTAQDPAPGAGGARSREDLCLEALVLTMQNLQGYDVSKPGKVAQVQGLVELLAALVGHMSEARVCGALPELFGSVVPQLEALQRSSSSSSNPSAGSSSGSLRQCARELHEQLMALGG